MAAAERIKISWIIVRWIAINVMNVGAFTADATDRQSPIVPFDPCAACQGIQMLLVGRSWDIFISVLSTAA
jgi:hypothetical protein